MPIPCRDPARPDQSRRTNRHGTVPKTRSMNMDHDLHDEPTRPAHHVQRPFKSHETCIRHPCGQAGQPKASRLRDRQDNIKALAGRPSSCHPACLLFTITSEQDNGGHKHAPLQTLSLIYGCFARHQGLVEPDGIEPTTSSLQS